MTTVIERPKTSQQQGVRPRMDILRNDEGYSIYIEIPGVVETDLELTVRGTMLSLNATTEAPEDGPERLIRQEFKTRNYSCSFNLPEDVDDNKINASLKHGLLTLRLGKREEALPRKIDVNAS